MRVTRVDNGVEKRVVIGMVVSTDFLKRVQSIYQADLMAIPFARTVADWCIDYYRQFEKSPGRHIQDIFDEHERNGLPKDQANLIADFLVEVSEEFERGEAGKFNTDYLLNQAENHFDKRNLKLLVADVEALLDKGDRQAAGELIAAHRRVALPSSLGVEPLTDVDAIQRAFEGRQDAVLFTFPGALGKLLGPVVRHDFIGILGPEKRGKTWALWDFAMRGVRARCNVAYFDCGDSPEDEHLVRIHTYNTGRSPDLEGRVKIPVFDCENNQRGACINRTSCEGRGASGESIGMIVTENGRETWKRLDLEEREDWVPCARCAREGRRDYKPAVWHKWSEALPRLTWQEAAEAGRRTAAQSRKRLKLSCHPSGTLSVSDSENIMDAWERDDGFIPDIVIYDYPDIMAAEPADAHKSARDQINGIWMGLRRVSLARHCAVVAVTQSDADSYDQRTLRERNFSEDKRKFSHVTKFLTLNQTPQEKRDGVIRIGTMFVRSRNFDSSRTVTVLRCLDIGRPYMGSY